MLLNGIFIDYLNFKGLLMNTVYEDKLIYIRNKINKIGAREFASIMSKLIENDDKNKITKRIYRKYIP